ncbi:MAG: polysaccharide biosynthesis protein, partial [Thermodesulfobacteriota bacterium]
AMNGGGKIYVLDMGEPVLIRTLAEKMIRLFGKEPDRDIRIEYIGLRPGEKLEEEMFHKKEKLRGTKHPKLLLASSRDFSSKWLEEKLNNLWKAAKGRDIPAIINQLHILVPEYEGSNFSDQKKYQDSLKGQIISAEFIQKNRQEKAG